MENIRYGANVTDEEIIAVSKQIGAHDFIMSLEQGYQTNVHERGLILSQGQRQLISFARALLVNPRILILDEATSSLDSYSEMQLQKAIEELTKNRTSIIIAHRLSTIRNADKILVLDKGTVVEYGTHDELIDKDGLYAKLYKLQFKDLQLAKEAQGSSSAGAQ
jgi:ATP-binding cassette subfamily B protein